MNVTGSMKKLAITGIASLGLIAPTILSGITAVEPTITANASRVRRTRRHVNYAKQVKQIQKKINSLNRLMKYDERQEAKRKAAVLGNRIRLSKRVLAKTNNRHAKGTLRNRINANRIKINSIRKSAKVQAKYANKVLSDFYKLAHSNEPKGIKVEATRLAAPSKYKKAPRTKKVTRRASRVKVVNPYAKREQQLNKSIADMKQSIKKDQAFLTNRAKENARLKKQKAVRTKYDKAQQKHVVRLQRNAKVLRKRLNSLQDQVKRDMVSHTIRMSAATGKKQKVSNSNIKKLQPIDIKQFTTFKESELTPESNSKAHAKRIPSSVQYRKALKRIQSKASWKRASKSARLRAERFMKLGQYNLANKFIARNPKLSKRAQKKLSKRAAKYYYHLNKVGKAEFAALSKKQQNEAVKNPSRSFRILNRAGKKLFAKSMKKNSKLYRYNMERLNNKTVSLLKKPTRKGSKKVIYKKSKVLRKNNRKRR